MKQKHFLYGTGLCAFSRFLLRECSFSLALCLSLNVPARGRAVYMAVLVSREALLRTGLHLRHGLCRGGRGQNLKGTKGCSASEIAMNEVKVRPQKWRSWCGSSRRKKERKEKVVGL